MPMVLGKNSIDHKIMDAYNKTYGPTLDASHRISFSKPSSFTFNLSKKKNLKMCKFNQILLYLPCVGVNVE
jgi:hypothetical protein